MIKKSRFVQSIKALVPLALLNFARFFYSSEYRSGRREQRMRRRIRAAWLEVAEGLQQKVLTGPFHGMDYIQEAVCSALPPKILGTYEMELHDLIEAVVESRPAFVIDIGAAEGFYAIGLAMRLPECRVIAFETDPHARELLHDLATLNGVADRIQISGHCSSDELRNCLMDCSADCVLICDAEGAEMHLLDPMLVPMLAGLTLLVELHPWVYPDIKNVLCSRFRDSSIITTVVSRQRVAGDFPRSIDLSLSDQTKLDCMNEMRPPDMEWLSIKPNISKVAEKSSH